MSKRKRLKSWMGYAVIMANGGWLEGDGPEPYITASRENAGRWIEPGERVVQIEVREVAERKPRAKRGAK